ncbi:SRPBCC family protein [Xenophilus azovorans]|uniref:SRPBCC family protein n=1 Tax=Xenophilus azovorans TaxID=151755 RepID=UPI00069157F7|nr:SRPBCC family protein [Xenophilus azovorans]
MKLNNSFVVEAPLEQVWTLFDELDTVIPCMPGAAYLGREGDEHRVSMKVKIGAIVSDFQGTVSFLERDGASHRTVMRGAARDAGGKGAASATIETRLAAADPARTQVAVETDLSMTGRLAQFGGPIIADIAQRLVGQFTGNLQQVLQTRVPATAPARPLDASPDAPMAASAASAATAPPAPAQPGEVQPLDLGNVVGRSLAHHFLRYALPALACFALGWLLGRYG